VQDPEDAIAPGMPESALAVGATHEVAPIATLGSLIARLVGTHVEASGFTCPDCSGALWEMSEGDLVSYRCRIGHSYSEDAMVDAQGSAVEAALLTALEMLEDRSKLLRRLAERMNAQPRTQERFLSSAHEADERSAVIRRILHTGAIVPLVDDVVAG
jgi:two-component system chemotaxis response regulator CheB